MIYNEKQVRKRTFNHLGTKIHSHYTVTYNTPDTAKLKSAIFVNIIHSLDALHLMMMVNSIPHNNFLPIHDALLFRANENLAEIMKLAAHTFYEIHNEHAALKHIVNSTSNRVKSSMTYVSIVAELCINPPKLVEKGMKLMA